MRPSRRVAAAALGLLAAAHLLPRPSARRALQARDAQGVATPATAFAALLEEAHVARRAGGPEAAALYVRAGLASAGRRAAADEALYWLGLLALRRGDPFGRAVLGELIVIAFEPDLRLRAASALVTHARDIGEARASVTAARAAVARRADELTPDGARWRRALERLETRVR